MHDQSPSSRAHHNGRIGHDDGVDASGFRRIEDALEFGQVLVENHGIDRQIESHARRMSALDKRGEILLLEGRCSKRAHVERADPEIDGVRPRGERGGKGFPRTRGRKNFEIGGTKRSHDSAKGEKRKAQKHKTRERSYRRGLC